MFRSFLSGSAISFVGALLWADAQGMAIENGVFHSHVEANESPQCLALNTCLADRGGTIPDHGVWLTYGLYLYYD